MRSTFFTCLAAISLAAVAPFATGCAASPESETGSLAIPLQQPGPDGALYRLTGAFEIVGPGGTQFVDASGFADSLQVPLEPGITTVRLLDGWTLEKSSDAGVTYTPVSAVLGSANPFALRVRANLTDTAVFQFLVRSATGQLAIRFGVTLQPRELAGGMIVQAVTGDYASYAGGRLDFAIYHDLAAIERLTLPDGTKQVVYTAGASATEFFHDSIGLLSGTIGPSMSGAFLQYRVAAKPDGSQELAGELSAFSDPFPTFGFGPYTLAFGNLPLDAEGFPTDVTFTESLVPFALSTDFPSGPASISGVLRLRVAPVSN